MKMIFAMALVLGMVLIGMAGAVVFAGNATVQHDFGVGGNASVDGTFSSGDAHVKGDLQVDNDFSAGGTINGENITTIEDRLTTVETDLGNNDTRVSALESYALHLSIAAGGSAGNHTLTGVHVGDALGGVVYATKTAGNLTTLADLSAEFAGSGKGIIDTNVIANGGGTDTSGGYLLAAWVDKTS